MKNPLEIYFKENDGRIIHKWIHYFEIYHRHFQRYRNKECIILEIGVSMGGSLQMWKDYFGDQAKIYGIDIDENCKQFEDKSTHIFIGSQSDRDFLRKIKEKIPKIDALFYLYPKLSVGGYCIIDDWGAIEACKKAVNDYRKFFGIDEKICSINHDGVFWKKEKQIKTVSRKKFNREVINRNKVKMQRRDRWIQVKQVIKNGIRNFVHVE